jgi:hypothetical protein
VRLDSDDSTKILSLCELKEIQGFITPVILSNSYYLLKKNSMHGKVIEKLKGLMTIIDVLIMDKEVIMNALYSKFNDFEDALQNFSVLKNNKIDFIITRNGKDYKHSSLPVFTPESYIKSRTSRM